jgi:hypothetical protein
MKRANLVAAILAAISGSARAQGTALLPGHLAVLRAGDGVVSLHLKQSPIFVDQFDADRFNAGPSATVRVATNGAEAFYFNGHAATEGILTRSADHRMLVFAGYGGIGLLTMPGTPSQLPIQRGFCTVDAAGTTHTFLYHLVDVTQKINPRGAATDGKNNFWDCGNSGATLFYTPEGTRGPVEFESVPNTRAMRITARGLYATLNGPDATSDDKSAGIYRFVDKTGNALPVPRQADASIELTVPASAPYTRIAGFDISPDETVAYIADNSAGVQKYVKTGNAWKLAYNFAIPQNIPAELNHDTGCFGLAVNFSGPAPIVYATTTEGYGGGVNSNRVVRIVDTNATAVVTTVAQAPGENIAYRGIDFTPEQAAPATPKP